MKAVITGCAGGIGSSLCAAFRESGYHVIGVDVHACGACDDHVDADLDRVAAEDGAGNELKEALAHRVEGGLDVLINNAAVQLLGGTEELSREALMRSLRVNLAAPFLLSRDLLPFLIQAHGSIINIASVHAFLTKPGFVGYATSKAALVGLTRSMAVDLGGRVRVNAICPAAIDTPMLREGFAGDDEGLARLGEFHPAGHIGEPRDVAATALFLASPAARFITGQALFVDGGIGGRLHDPA
jgi:NAD(P)-dependent dehydrogenase (short-subunit alcohol dehydrogenase family)